MSEDNAANMQKPALKFAAFRHDDAPELAQIDQSRLNMSEEIVGKVNKYIGSKVKERGEVRTVFANESFSLIYIWWKSGWPVILHSHDVNCLYYVTSGSLKMGGQTYGKGDGFFVPCNVPYTYTAGPEGVELLEFRDSSTASTKVTTNSDNYWERIGAAIDDRLDAWKDERKPSEVVQPA